MNYSLVIDTGFAPDSDGKTVRSDGNVTVNYRLKGSVQNKSVYRSSLIDVKSKHHNLVVSRVNLKLKLWKRNYLPGSYDVSRVQD